MATRRNRFLTTLALPALAVVAGLVASALFIVDEREKALVLRFGRVVDVQEEPGLNLKMPFIDDVVKYDDRILGLQTTPLEVTPLDDRRLIVDAFARWRITEPVQFRQAVGASGIDAALVRLDPIVRTAIREVLGSVPSTAVLSDDRTALMNRIRDEARMQAQGLGVEIIDVRLTRTDLPEQNLNATYARMRAEREREAADEIARGGEAARRVRAAADRTVVELTSDARRNAEIIRGEADAARNVIYADAFGRDPEFFAFSRSMTSYERALQGNNSRIVMQPDGEFFAYLRDDGSAGATPLTPFESLPADERGNAQETAQSVIEGGSVGEGEALTARPLEMPWDGEEGAVVPGEIVQGGPTAADIAVEQAQQEGGSGETAAPEADAGAPADPAADASGQGGAVAPAGDAAGAAGQPDQPSADAPAPATEAPAVAPETSDAGDAAPASAGAQTAAVADGTATESSLTVPLLAPGQ